MAMDIVMIAMARFLCNGRTGLDSGPTLFSARRCDGGGGKGRGKLTSHEATNAKGVHG